MHEPDRQRRFTPEQVQDIVGRAAELGQHDDRLTYQEVIDIATQVGIDEDAVAAAIEQPTPPATPGPKRSLADYVLACLGLRPLEPRPVDPPTARP